MLYLENKYWICNIFHIMINLIFVNYLLLGDGINLSFFQNRFNNLINTINVQNVRFCKAHRWKLKGSLCSACYLEHCSVTWQIKINIWKTLGIFTLYPSVPLCPSEWLLLRTPSVKWPFRIWHCVVLCWLTDCGKSDFKCHHHLSLNTHGLWKTSVWRFQQGITQNSAVGTRGLFGSAVNLSTVCTNVKCQHFIVLTSNFFFIVNF